MQKRRWGGAEQRLQHPRWNAPGNLTEILGSAVKVLSTAVEDKAVKHRLHHGVSQGHSYPDKRLTRDQHEHVLHHNHRMPSYMAEGKDAHFMCQQGSKSSHTLTCKLRDSPRHTNLACVPNSGRHCLGQSVLTSVSLLTGTHFSLWKGLEQSGGIRLRQDLHPPENEKPRTVPFFLTAFHLLIRAEGEALALPSVSRCHVLIVTQQSILV